jgi:hypothetical protein
MRATSGSASLGITIPKRRTIDSESHVASNRVFAQPGRYTLKSHQSVSAAFARSLLYLLRLATKSSQAFGQSFKPLPGTGDFSGVNLQTRLSKKANSQSKSRRMKSVFNALQWSRT